MNNILVFLPMFLFESRRKVVQVVLLVTVLLFSELVIELDIAHAACRLGNVEYPAGKKISSGGKTYECQSDGTWQEAE